MKSFNNSLATNRLREPINEGKVKFTIDDEDIDSLFNNKFEAEVDYVQDGTDVYYVTDQSDLEKFVDYVESSGLDADKIQVHEYFKEEGSVTGGEAYNASLHASKKKQNPYAEDVLSGYKKLKGFRPGHTKDTGGFQYSDLWGVNEAMEVGDTAKVSMKGDINYNKIGEILDVTKDGKYFTLKFKNGKSAIYHQSDVTTPAKVKDFQEKPTLDIDEAYDKSKIKTNAEELARVQDYLSTATSSQKSPAEDRIKKLKALVSLEKKHNTQLPVLHYGTQWVDYLKKQGVKTSQELDAKLSTKKEGVNEEDIQEAYVPDNIKSFAKRKGITSLVSQVARWAEKAGKRIVGGTAIGKDYGTLILDLTHQGGEIRINTDDETVEVNGDWVDNYDGFITALGDESLNENYHRFKKETVTRSKEQQMHEAVKLIRKKLYEADKVMDYVKTMKEELGLQEYKSHTKKLMEKLQTSIAEIYKKYKNVK